MDINALYPSKYLKAADIKGKKIEVVIDSVSVEKMGDDTKPVVYFANKEKGVVLNKTNSMTIASSYGTDTDDWIGKTVHLYTVKVNNQKGELVDSIRVEVPSAVVAAESDIPF